MTTSESIKIQLASVRAEFLETCSHLTDEALGWAPAEGIRTIHGQFVEILGTEHSTLMTLRSDEKAPAEEVDAAYWAVKSVSGLIEELAKLRAQSLAFLDSCDEAALDAPAEISDWYSQYLAVKPTPKSELFRFIARHESYHSGQLVSYLWAKGDNPYKWD